MALFSIRPMREDDVPQVIEIENRIYEFPWSARNFLDSLRAGYDLHCFLLDDVLVGYIVMMQVVDEVHLLNISVSADQQGKGYGKHLLQWGLSRARMAGLEGMLLEVRPSNTVAKALYDQQGFKLIGVRKNYYPARVGREDALVLFKRLGQGLDISA
ncbi:MAG TPA: ribosomal protein S18-alanine N-acetyltransferase [Limnobacter sp.]|uniref:ribosomal protein S18-alanine N-acetyltransferase n=1 Tax=Limnobacter sp. TaxID=2003368 RepID=UPI002ED7C2D2